MAQILQIFTYCLKTCTLPHFSFIFKYQARKFSNNFAHFKKIIEDKPKQFSTMTLFTTRKHESIFYCTLMDKYTLALTFCGLKDKY